MANRRPLVINGGIIEQLQDADALYVPQIVASVSDIVLIPATNKAIRITADGNTRGANSVDLQALRGSASQVASGGGSAIIAGAYNTASGSKTVIIGGEVNTIAGNYSSSVGGTNITFTSSASHSGSVGGYYNTLDAQATSCMGMRGKAYMHGQQTVGILSATTGSKQTSVLGAARNTTNDTPTELFLDGYGASDRMVIPENTAWYFTVKVIARETNNDYTTCGWHFEGLISRDTGGNATLKNLGTIDQYINDFNWSCAVSADTTNQSLKIGVTGVSGENISWAARIELVEVTG
jgi:hypothetical protein